MLTRKSDKKTITPSSSALVGSQPKQEPVEATHLYFKHPSLPFKDCSTSIILVSGSVLYFDIKDGVVSVEKSGAHLGDLIESFRRAGYVQVDSPKVEVVTAMPKFSYGVVAHTDNSAEEGWSGIVPVEIGEDIIEVKFTNGLTDRITDERVFNILISKGYLEHTKEVY